MTDASGYGAKLTNSRTNYKIMKPELKFWKKTSEQVFLIHNKKENKKGRCNMKRELKRADFETREFTKYGNTYALQTNGVWTKNGKPDANLRVGSHINGQNIYCLWDGSAFVGKLQDDFGFLTNSWPFERANEGQRMMPDGTIEKYTWDVYRTEKGMYCEEVCRRWEADGVHHVPGTESYNRPVAMV